MLVSILPVPFADADRQRQYEAVAAALRADPDAPSAVLLGNLGAFTPVVVDALLVRPASLTLLFLTPRTGKLTLPELPGHPWLLDGQPLPNQVPAGNPLVHYQQQVPLALAWLSEQLGQPLAELPPCAGLALFEAPLTFGEGVETQLHRQAAAYDFQLVGGADLLPLRLLPPFAAATLAEEELLDWADYLAGEPEVVHQPGRPESTADYLGQKLRQLWRWLGAEDIPADPPYGGFPPSEQHLRDQQEQARLHHLRQELQAELAQHRQEAAAREATRTQELAQLRQQLAQAGQPAATRQAEQQAQAALEAEVRTARAELAARHHELDARIQELGQLMQQLQAQAKAPAAPAVSFPAGPRAPRQATALLPRATGAPAKAARPVLKLSSYRPLRRAERWGVLGLGLALLGGGAWGVVHVVRQSAAPARRATASRAIEHTRRRVVHQPAPVIIYDTLANEADLYHTDTDAADIAHSAPASSAMPVSASPSAPLHVDSARLVIPETTLLPRDTTAAEASPAP